MARAARLAQLKRKQTSHERTVERTLINTGPCQHSARLFADLPSLAAAAAGLPLPMPALFKSRKNKLVTTLATATKNDLQTAVYKATAADQLPPKEKHVLFVLQAAAEPTQQAETALCLAKRLQACRSAKTTVVAAKTLVLVHRLAVAGRTEVLDEAIPELPQVCGGQEARHAQADYVEACASYLKELCEWPQVGVLRTADASRWRAYPLHQITAELPTLQKLLARALECASLGSLGASAGAALHALRLRVCEDALLLYRCEAAAAAALQSELLALPAHLVGARPCLISQGEGVARGRCA